MTGHEGNKVDTAKIMHPHSITEDVQGLLFGSLMVGFGTVLLASAGLVTGQLAGLSLLVSYWGGWEFGPVYLLLSLPFYGFGLRRLGWAFLLRTIFSVVLMVAVTMILPKVMVFDRLSPWVAAGFAGLISGAGLMALFRHRASLGGIGAVALDIQDSFGFKAGWVQMIFDICVFGIAFVILPWDKVLWSAMGAVVLNLVIAINHRRDRYIA